MLPYFLGKFFILLGTDQQCMTRPFMIRIPFKGRGCYANVYVHEGRLKEYHVHLIDPDHHPELPHKIIFTVIEGRLRLSEPVDLSRTIMSLFSEEIEKKHL